MRKITAKTAVTIIFFAAVFIFSSLYAGYSLESEMFRTSQDITMEKANSARDPYSLLFNLKLTAPGTITAHIRKPEGSFRLGKKQHLFRIIISDARAYKPGSSTLNEKYIKRLKCFKHERGLVEYSVDSLELGSSKGEFIVLITNYYDKKPYNAHLQLMYPVAKQAESKLKPVEMKLRPIEVKGISDEQ